MADDKKPRSYEEFHKQDKGKGMAAFNNAQQAKQKTKSPERVESQQVKKSAPNMQPKPPGSVRGAVDRQAHNERKGQDKKAADKARAQQLAISINKRKESQRERGKEKDRER